MSSHLITRRFADVQRLLSSFAFLPAYPSRRVTVNHQDGSRLSTCSCHPIQRYPLPLVIARRRVVGKGASSSLPSRLSHPTFPPTRFLPLRLFSHLAGISLAPSCLRAYPPHTVWRREGGKGRLSLRASRRAFFRPDGGSCDGGCEGEGGNHWETALWIQMKERG